MQCAIRSVVLIAVLSGGPIFGGPFRLRENMVGVNMVLAGFACFKHGLYKSCGIEWFEGIIARAIVTHVIIVIVILVIVIVIVIIVATQTMFTWRLQPCFHVARTSETTRWAWARGMRAQKSYVYIYI